MPNLNDDITVIHIHHGPQGAAGPKGDAGAPGAPGVGSGGQGVPTGGTTGQVLAKTSNTNYAVGWTAPPVSTPPVPFGFDSSTPFSTTQTSTPQDYLTETIPLDPGVWGCEFACSANMFRSANAGEMELRIVTMPGTGATGNTTERATRLNSANIDISLPRFIGASRARKLNEGITVGAGGGAVILAIRIRGITVAGTTTIVNAMYSGTWYRLA